MIGFPDDHTKGHDESSEAHVYRPFVKEASVLIKPSVFRQHMLSQSKIFIECPHRRPERAAHYLPPSSSADYQVVAPIISLRRPDGKQKHLLPAAHRFAAGQSLSMLSDTFAWRYGKCEGTALRRV